MSKTSLKKELKGYTADELIELICECYDAKLLTARDYLEFYLNPNVGALIAKATDVIAKEFTREKRHCAKFRISHVKKQLAILKAYGIDPLEQASMMVLALECACGASARMTFTVAQMKSIEKLLADTLTFCDRAGIFSRIIGKITDVLDHASLTWRNRSMMKMLKAAIEEYRPATLG